MQKLYFVLPALLMVGLLATPAYTQIHDGDFSLSIDVALTSSTFSTEGGSDDVDVDTAAFGLKFGWFPTKHVQIAPRVAAMLLTTESGADETEDGVLDFVIDVNWMILPDGRVVPYIGVHGGGSQYWSTWGDDTESVTGTIVGAQAGALFFIDEHSSIFVEARFSAAQYSLDEVTAGDVDEDRGQLLLGYSYTW